MTPERKLSIAEMAREMGCWDRIEMDFLTGDRSVGGLRVHATDWETTLDTTRTWYDSELDRMSDAQVRAALKQAKANFAKEVRQYHADMERERSDY